MPDTPVWAQSGWHEYLSARNAGLPRLPAVTNISEEVVRILGGNPGDMQLQGTNTYLVGSGQSRILIDTGQGFPIWLTTLVEFLEKHHLSISLVLLTHWHIDHTGGLPALLAQYPHLKNAVYKAHPDRGQTSIRDGQIFTTEGATLRALFTPGHSLDHMCFVLEETETMFTGDNVLGHGNSVVVENLGRYMTSLQLMKKSSHIEDIQVGYPGHGAVIEDLPSKLAIYIRHWETRERVVMAAFTKARGNTRSSLTTSEIITHLYGPSMEAMARPFITQVLSKLSDEGKVSFILMGEEKKWFIV
ncbi:unnamed protein product [Penicillium salamii]|uniref:Metallo-beta-lactamase domain-containing protein n=1 Tax=Penicillium salamii TaxID=1612424 RepID=A0A9W4JKJ4_9EURO|nr:unnamed protein product [Penicillium salamii]CAG8398018.1 unnamed protein product [Penicillium salamii]CAG8403582.1 unnamed protein product [Penicillium salamii]CAG8417976.1 unnamed protein product [Penicillium salamii]